MLKSMTGYGTIRADFPHMTVNVEVKSLNSKSFEAFVKLPHCFSDKEMELRNLLTQNIERGKVSFFLEISFKQEKPSTRINQALVKSYYEDLKQTSDLLGIKASETDFLRHILTMPDVLIADNATNYDAEWNTVLQVIKDALKNFETFRLQEGNITQIQIEQYCKRIADLLQLISDEDARRLVDMRLRLQKKVMEFSENENFDKNRFEQELIYYIEKLDISEEKIRLNNHIQYFNETLADSGANGKKLNFIAQEMGREINTIGSKANDAIIQRMVVEMKDELEKIKEQTANIY